MSYRISHARRHGTLTTLLLLLVFMVSACSDQEAAQQTNTAPVACSTDTTVVNFVNSSIVNANAWEGGLLYDKWWVQAGRPAPSQTNALFLTQNFNTRTGSDTWRCKECHGWDYKGAAGAYGSGSHRTDFAGIFNARVKTAVEVFCAIRNGENVDSRHNFTTVLDDQNILKLTRFIISQGNEGLADSTSYINSNKQALGSAAAGNTVYNTVANCDTCHGTDGRLNAGLGNTLGQLTSDNPWEVLHKIRYGHPGSVPAMPAYIRNDLPGYPVLQQQQVRDVMTYMQQDLPGTGNTPQPTACVNDSSTFVNTNWNSVTAWRGGQLYDNWAATLNGTGPTSNHPLWSTRTSNVNTRTGAVTWRCKECHGWDYEGRNGAYGIGSSHYTGFNGIRAAVGKSRADVFCAIKDGSTVDSRHAFNASTTGNMMQDADILALTKFILSTGDNAMVNMNEYINRTTRVALGDANLGETVYLNRANCDVCHDANGARNMGTTTLGALSTANPWEVLHKIRYGHPNSNPVMPSYIQDGMSGTYNELTTNEMKNVLRFAQTLTGNTTPPPLTYSSCLTDKASYVNSAYNSESATQGGALYDKWWAALGYSAGPTQNHPVWSQQSANTRSGETTWRCKECHGWDYQGRDGAYGFGNSHYTGFPGVMGAVNNAAINVFCSIYAGTPSNADHQFNPSNSSLTDQAILQLTKFILDPNRGVIDMDTYINPNTREIIGANINQGSIEFSGRCAGCHGTDGTIYSGTTTLGQLATDNPWEVLHKIRYGHPGSNPVMPAFLEELGVTVNTMRDILAYVQTLTKTPNVGDPTPITEVGQVVLGGLLYDNWIVETGADVPNNDNPLWALQSFNTRTGADTWRCKECHGWDYKGKDGQYDADSSHYTGFAGVLYAANKSEEAIYTFIRDGFFYPQTGETMHRHAGLMSDEEIRALAKFITQGVLDMDNYILPTLGTALGNETAGQFQYVFDGQFVARGNCSLCHGLDGRQINFGTRTAPEYLGDLAIANPWEVMHKALYGQPGSIMPSMLLNGLQAGNVADVITYIQRNLEATPPPPQNNDDD